VHGRRVSGHGGHQHDAFGTEVDDAGAFIDQQTERREGEHGARVERGRK
jgi:hypothetical protein